MKLNYINPIVPEVKMPEYPGQYYEATVPATLDLAERARLAVNALTGTLDPEYDYELYWIVDLLAKKQAMYHTVDDHVQAKFFQALPLVRTASGSSQNMDVEKSLMQTYLRMQGEDGLIYIPIKGRPWALPSEPNPWAGLDFMPQGDHWCSLIMNGRVLGAFCIYAVKDPEGPWREAANCLVEGIKKVTIVEGDIAYLFMNCTEPCKLVEKPESRPVGMRAGANAWVAQGLIQCYRCLGNKDALEIGEKMIRYVMRDSGYFGDNGEFNKEFPGKSEEIHFHAHTNQIMTALELVQAKQNLDMKVRIAEWVKPEDVKCTVNGKNIKIVFDGRYLQAGTVYKGDEVVVEFPIYEKTVIIIVEKQKYTITLRGNDVVAIDPPGKNRPLYQRGHYRNGQTLWKKITRFAPNEEIKWC